MQLSFLSRGIEMDIGQQNPDPELFAENGKRDITIMNGNSGITDPESNETSRNIRYQRSVKSKKIYH